MEYEYAVRIEHRVGLGGNTFETLTSVDSLEELQVVLGRYESESARREVAANRVEGLRRPLPEQWEVVATR